MQDKRVTVIKNGETNGKLMFLPSTKEEFLSQLFLLFKSKVSRIFSDFGSEICDINLIRDNDILYVSDGNDFINPSDKINKKLLNKSDWITLNVGGRLFTTTKHTLASDSDSMLARMFAEDEGEFMYTPSDIDANGAYLIDRNPTYFEPIVNYLRNGQLIYDTHLNPEGILEEAKFFSIQSLIPLLEQKVQSQKAIRDDDPLTRRDVVHALIRTPHSAELRFQGVNLKGADLSKLDLRSINFKYANLSGCILTNSNLSWCCIERADFSHTNLDDAKLIGVKSLCANFEGACMRNCNFEDPGGNRANMEFVNMKEVDLEGSRMGGINLRVATLKNANLKNCYLRGAVLAGADLENCDLSGSDLHEANLRGANLKGASFELMLTPLHMSQTIR